MTARTYGRFDWRAKALAWSEHLYQRRKCVVRPRNVPKRWRSQPVDATLYLKRKRWSVW
jgi:hypothetical protein